MSLFKGCATAVITPMCEDGSVDFKKFEEIIEWQIAEGINALVVCGTTGEASTLDNEEHIEVIRFAVEKVNKRIPVIGGGGSNDTRHGVDLCKQIEETGVDGLLLVTPYYNKCSQKGLISHYTACADGVNIPCILYSVPGRTGVNIEPQTVLELSKHKNIIGIKEATGNISQVAEIARLVPKDFDIYSGNDDMVVPLMSLGGSGYISVLSNVVPKKSVEMTDKYMSGDIKGACKLQLEMKPLIDTLFADVNPIPVKAAMNIMKKCDLIYRLPLCEPSQEVIEKLRNELKVLDII